MGDTDPPPNIPGIDKKETPDALLEETDLMLQIKIIKGLFTHLQQFDTRIKNFFDDHQITLTTFCLFFAENEWRGLGGAVEFRDFIGKEQNFKELQYTSKNGDAEDVLLQYLKKEGVQTPEAICDCMEKLFIEFAIYIFPQLRTRIFHEILDNTHPSLTLILEKIRVQCRKILNFLIPIS